MKNRFAKLSVKTNEDGHFYVEDDLGRVLPCVTIAVDAGTDRVTTATITVYLSNPSGEHFINRARRDE